MPKLKEQPKWVTDLREDIREQQRFGWSVREKKGSVEVIRYWADTGKRQSAVLPIEWRRENKREILNALHGINAALNKGLSLKDAVKLNFEVAAGPKPTTNWMEIYQRFKDFKVLNGKTKDSTFDKNYRPRLEQLIDTLNSEDGPSNGNVAIEAMRFNRKGEGEPGTRGRKLRIEYSVQFLRFAVQTCGASRRWLPADKVIQDSIGDRLRNDDAKQASNAGQAVFLTDEQIVRLYESIKDDRWRRAVGLLSLFGLRGVELLYCRPGSRQGEGPLTGLHVEYVKHTAKGSTEPRFVKPCSPVGMDISQELLTELALERSLGRSGLPPLGSSDGARVLGL